MIRPIPKDLYLGMHINESHVLGLTLVLLCKGGSAQPEDVLPPRRCAPKPNPNPKPKPKPKPKPNPNPNPNAAASGHRLAASWRG